MVNALGLIRHSIAQFVILGGRIDQIITAIRFAQGRCFKKRVLRKFGPLSIRLLGQNDLWGFAHGTHIVCQFNELAALGNQMHGSKLGVDAWNRAETADKIYPTIIVHKNAGVILESVPFFRAQQGSIRVMHMVIKLEWPHRGFRHRHRDAPAEFQCIEQIIAAISAALHIGGKQAHGGTAFSTQGVLHAAVTGALVPPVGKVIRAGRPTDIIVQAEIIPAKAVMAAVYIHSAIEHMRFAVRHILMGWQIRVDCLFGLVHLALSPIGQLSPPVFLLHCGYTIRVCQIADAGSTSSSAGIMLAMGYCLMPLTRIPATMVSTPPQLIKSCSISGVTA